MSKPLSISATQTYLECPAKWKLHYIDRIRPVTTMSYFIFGSAIDKGLNALLMEDGSPMEACDEELKRLVVERVEFLPMDYDGEIIDEKTKEVLLKKCLELGYKGDDVDRLATTLLAKPQSELAENQRKALALCCSASLRAKAKLMLEAYRKKVLPLIKRVESVQEEVKWKDELGNEFIAVLDLPAEIEGHGSLIADNKTASRPYDADSVRSSPQLAIYAKATGKKKAAFFVMEKMIRKNRVKTCSVCGNDGTGKRHKTCDALISVPDKNGDHFDMVTARCDSEWTETIKPEVSVQIIIDDVSQEEMDMVQSSMTGVAESIKKGCFPKNIKSCEQRFGQKKVRCPYFNFCRNGDMTGLEKKEETR